MSVANTVTPHNFGAMTATVFVALSFRVETKRISSGLLHSAGFEHFHLLRPLGKSVVSSQLDKPNQSNCSRWISSRLSLLQS